MTSRARWLPPRRVSIATIATIVLAAALAGCALIGNDTPRPYPAGCVSLGFSARRCSAIVARARDGAAPSLDGGVASVGLLGPAADSTNLGHHQVARVVFGLRDGTTVVQPVVCVGVPAGPDDAVCQEPRLAVRSVVSHDVPCSGDAPAGCPSQIVPDPVAAAAAHPLRLSTLDVPIEGTGRHEVEVGAVGLPNGYVTRIDATVVNDQPADFWISGGILLDLRPSDATRPPFGSVYLRPLVAGAEQATLWLVFDVTEASPGAVLHLADIVVQ
jgi:hypothetical protein